MTLSRAYESAPNIKLVGGMTRAQRARAYRQMERIRTAYERSAKSMLRSTFDAERQALEALEDPDERSILQAVKSTYKQKERILSWLYTSVAEEVYPMVDEDMTAKAWRERLERKASGMPEEDDVWLVAIRRWILEQCGTKIVQIDETTLEEIRRIYYASESVIDFRIRLDSLYLDQIIPNRSSVIARTESTAASNRASLETAKSLDSARTEYKMWNTALDAEVRDTHKHLESRSTELSESFRWTGRYGQVQMDCPADSTHGAPAGRSSTAVASSHSIRDDRIAIMGHFSHMTELITKHLPFTEFKEVTAEGNFRGILSTYGNEDLVGDVCDQGCWDESVKAKGGDFPLLWQHDMTEPIGSFKVVDTTAALVIEGHFNQDVQRGREAFALLKAGDIRGLSVGFNLQDWAYVDGVRHVTKADLWEGSFVTFPANTLAYAEAKSMAQKKSADVRKGVAALPEFKSLTEEQQEKILRAIDEAVSGDVPEDEESKGEEPKDPETEDESKEDEPEGEGEPDPEDDSEEQKAMNESLRELKSSFQALKLSIKDVQA